MASSSDGGGEERLGGGSTSDVNKSTLLPHPTHRGIIVERATLLSENHLSYVATMNRRGWKGEEVAVPLIVAFMEKYR